MIQIVGEKLTQWDVDRFVQVNGDVSHVHLANQGDSKAVVKEVVEGEVQIPSSLLQTGKTLLAYAVKDGRTLECKAFAVRKREQPENYIYEDEPRNYIYSLIDDVNEAIDNANKAAEELREAIENGEIDVGDIVKTVNGIEPDENGNVEIEVGGGGANVLMVRKEDDSTSHTVEMMYNHVKNDGVVILNYDENYYFPLHIDDVYAWFARIDDEGFAQVLCICNRMVEEYYFEYAQKSYVNEVVGDISTALDHIIELQEELIGL